MVSASVLPEQSGIKFYLNLCLNMGSCRWITPNLSLAIIFIPNGSLIFKIFLSIGLINFKKHIVTTRATNFWFKFTPFNNNIREISVFEVINSPRKHNKNVGVCV